jgi:hypothetical protein
VEQQQNNTGRKEEEGKEEEEEEEEEEVKRPHLKFSDLSPVCALKDWHRLNTPLPS